MNKLFLRNIVYVSATVFRSVEEHERYCVDRKRFITKHKIQITDSEMFIISRHVGYTPSSMYITFFKDLIDLKEEILNKEVFDLKFNLEQYYSIGSGFINGTNSYILLTDEELFYFHLKYSHLIKENNEN